MRQRAVIAMALAMRPRLLIADEPTTALDVTIQHQILAVVDQLRRDLDMATIWVTHDLGVVAQLVERVVVMYGGHVVEEAPVDQLFHAPQHPYTSRLLASLPDPTDDAGHRWPRSRVARPWRPTGSRAARSGPAAPRRATSARSARALEPRLGRTGRLLGAAVEEWTA